MASFHLKLAAVLATISVIYVHGQRNTEINLNVSPCPQIFHYENNQNEVVGIISVMFPVQQRNTLNVSFTYFSNFEGSSSLSLIEERQKVLRDIENGQMVYYRLRFPAWDDVLPRILYILRNGEAICEGSRVRPIRQEYVLRTVSLVSILTMRTNVVGSSNSNGNNQFRPPRPFNNNFLDNDYDNNFEQIVPVNRPTQQSVTRPSSTTRRPPQQTWAPTRAPTSSAPAVSNMAQCGMNTESAIVPLIFGGVGFEKGKFPWLGAMYVRSRIDASLNYQCVGNLITTKHLLTAAHCCDYSRTRTSIAPQNMLFALGLHDLLNLGTESDSNMIQAKYVLPHAEYKFGAGDADIAVIVLQRDAPFTDYIRPICLWPAQFGDGLDIIENTQGTIAGWGRSESATTPNIPSEVSIPVVDNEECLRSHPAFATITSRRTFCAGDKQNRGPCSGDSGSGFMLQRNSIWYLRGIVSLSLQNETTKLCDLNNYIVFTDIVRVRDWINNQIRDNT